jgi:hypothetical protein
LDIFFGKKKQKKTKTKKTRKEFEIFFLHSLSGILYEPYMLLDVPINAHFAAFPAGVGEADDASSGANEDIEDVAKFVRGRPVGHIHKRADFWAEHLHPDPYVRGILDQGFKVPVDWEKIPESYEEADNKSSRKNYDFVQEEVAMLVDSGQVIE